MVHHLTYDVDPSMLARTARGLVVEASSIGLRPVRHDMPDLASLCWHAIYAAHDEDTQQPPRRWLFA